MQLSDSVTLEKVQFGHIQPSKLALTDVHIVHAKEEEAFSKVQTEQFQVAEEANAAITEWFLN